jgi:hypothetical protein
MATQRQIEANRRNALLSTGPRTPEGKARASMNALRHGLTAETVVLQSESGDAYREIRDSLIDSYQPANAHEMMLVDQVAAGHWRTLRARRYEKAMLDLEIKTLKRIEAIDEAPDPEHDDEAAVAALCSNDESQYKNYFRYDGSISRDYYRAIGALERIQARRARAERNAAPAVAAAGASAPQTGFVSSPAASASEPAPEPRRRIGFVSSHDAQEHTTAAPVHTPAFNSELFGNNRVEQDRKLPRPVFNAGLHRGELALESPNAVLKVQTGKNGDASRVHVPRLRDRAHQLVNLVGRVLEVGGGRLPGHKEAEFLVIDR